MLTLSFLRLAFLGGVMILSGSVAFPARAAMQEQPVVKLRSLDKVTARTMTFEVRVGSTVKFGPIYIKVRACRKAPPIEQPESASFLQIWEVTPHGESKWIFSGWMFASSPALSPMDHPIYDVWVLDCMENKSTDPAPKADTPKAETKPDTAKDETVVKDGELSGAEVQPPQTAPPKPVVQFPEDFPDPTVQDSGVNETAPLNTDPEAIPAQDQAPINESGEPY